MKFERNHLKYLMFISIALILVLTFIPFTEANTEANNDINESTTIYFFWGTGCPFCEEQKLFLQELEEQYEGRLELKSFNARLNKELLLEIGSSYDMEPSGVPTTFIGEKYWVGFTPYIRNQIETYVEKCVDYGCDSLYEIETHEKEITDTDYTHIEDIEYENDLEEETEDEIIQIPLFGEINLSEQPLFPITLMISFIDGFNPCSLWVLTFLLGIVIYSGSRKKTTIIGLTYLIVTATVYGLFIVGLINVFAYIGFVDWIRLIVVLFALTFAAISIKDFFFYKKGGISLEIPDKFKPNILKDMRKIIDPKQSTASMIFATIMMALGITLVELPCTAGFPVLWTGILAAQGISMYSAYFAFLLITYVLVYLSVELVIFFGAVFTLKKTKFEEKHGRLLKLIGGAIMLALGLTFAFKPEYMENITATFAIFFSAIIGAVIIGLLYDKFVGFDEEEAKNVCVACGILGLDKQKKDKEKNNKEEDKKDENK